MNGVMLVLGSSTGGIGAHVVELTRRLAAAGTPVTVCGPAETGRSFAFTAAGADFTEVEIPARPGLGDRGAVRALRRAMTTSQPRVVHAHGYRAGLVAAAARRRRDPQALLVTLHNQVLGGAVRVTAARWAERYVVRSADVVLGASDDLVRRARALGASDARFAPVVAATAAPGRPRAAVRAELAVPGETPLVVSVGRLHPQKGYDTLVDVAARWRDRSPVPQVVIAGNGPSYLDLTARISAARAPVTLLGHRDDVPDLLAAADLAVVTSVWEARQLFAQEALRAGVPLVATAVGGLPELLGDAAVLVPAGDPDALDQAVRQLLDDPAARQRYAARGIERAAAWPTADQAWQQLWQLYRSFAGRPPTET